MTSCCSGRSVEMVNREPDMNTRRDFLKVAGAATGIVFCSCGLRDAAWAQQGGGQRLPVMVNGKRIKTIDVHAHCHFHEAVALTGDEANRVISQTRGAQQNFNPEIKLKKKPSEYLNQLYFDALVFTPEALRHLVAQVGASQVMLGSDHPFVWEQHPVDHIFATSTLSDDEKAAILGGNAARLLGVKA